MVNTDAGASTDLVVRGVSKYFGDAEVLSSIDLTVAPGSIAALLGPSGCGKTTLLRIIAGLEHPDTGEVRLGDRLVVGAGTFVAPQRRRIGLVFQDWALFPHLDVAANVGYGLDRGPDRAQRVDEALALVGLAGLGDRMPGTLSGGQQQRVALARALAPRPSVLLLDEPFSNLDTSLRVQVRSEVHELLVGLGVTTVLVTHDQEEAFVLGDQVAVMRRGRVVQSATPAELYRHPVDPWVADFVGEANLVSGEADGSVAQTALGDIALDGVLHGAVQVLVRPEELRVTPGGPQQVELVEFYGHDSVYVVGTGAERLRVREPAAPVVDRGAAVTVRYVGGPTTAWPADASSGTVGDAEAPGREALGGVPSAGTFSRS